MAEEKKVEEKKAEAPVAEVKSKVKTYDMHSDIKKVLIRKHIAATTIGIIGLCLALVINIAIGYDWGDWYENMGEYKIMINLTFAIVLIGIYCQVLFLIFNKRGYEAEVQGGMRFTIPTILTLADLAITFSFSIWLVFNCATVGQYNDDSASIHDDLIAFFVSFGLSVMLMIISEFMLFHLPKGKSKIYTDD